MSHKKHNARAEKNIINDVESYGWSVALLESDTATPSFAYTIGLWKNFDYPEIIVFGLATNTLHTLLNDVGELIREGKEPSLNTNNDEILNDFPVQFRQVDISNIADYFGYAQWFNNHEYFPAIQLFWPDKDKNFPWDSGYDEKLKFCQPILDRKLLFKFFEEENTAAFLSKLSLKEGKPILWVWHDDDDGTWSFANRSSDDMMLVGLGEVVEHDFTVNDLFNLPTGQIAMRKFVGDKWKRAKL